MVWWVCRVDINWSMRDSQTPSKGRHNSVLLSLPLYDMHCHTFGHHHFQNPTDYWWMNQPMNRWVVFFGSLGGSGIWRHNSWEIQHPRNRQSKCPSKYLTKYQNTDPSRPWSWHNVDLSRNFRSKNGNMETRLQQTNHNFVSFLFRNLLNFSDSADSGNNDNQSRKDVLFLKLQGNWQKIKDILVEESMESV